MHTGGLRFGLWAMPTCPNTLDTNPAVDDWKTEPTFPPGPLRPCTSPCPLDAAFRAAVAAVGDRLLAARRLCVGDDAVPAAPAVAALLLPPSATLVAAAAAGPPAM